jgi:glutaredoxin
MRWILAIAVAVLVVRAAQISLVPPDDDRALAEAAASEPGGRVLYQYVDDTGRVRLVERLDAVPPAKRAEAGRIVMSERPSPAVGPPGAWTSARRRVSPPAAVEVFTSDRCPHCDDQLRDLAAAGIRYRERNIDRDPAAARELAGHDRRRPVPTTVAGDRVFVGYNPQHAAQVRHALAYAAAGDDGPPAVELFTQATCGYSRRLMAELDRLGVTYVNHDIDRDPAARARLVALTGRAGVPVTTVGGDLLPGWSPDRAREIQARVEPGWSWWPF